MRQAEAQPSIAKTDTDAVADRPKPTREKRAKRLESTADKPQSDARFTANPTVASFDLTTAEMPSREEIRERAYFIYVARNGASGSSESDWLQAECELRSERCSISNTSNRRRI